MPTIGGVRRRLETWKPHPQFGDRAPRFGTHELDATTRLKMMAYLLGIMVGDASKGGSFSSGKMFVELQLTKRHPENHVLGEFVGLCANSVGLRFSEVDDRVRNERVPYGRFHWKSNTSELVHWLFADCLGLKSGQLATHDPVSVEWMLPAPRAFRVWFIQGVCDSDAYVHLQDQEVHIIASPNAEALSRILDSLGVENKPAVIDKMDVLRVKLNAAFALPVFSPISAG